MRNLKLLLNQLYVYNKVVEERNKNKEIFNVFDSMFKWNDEVNLHSRFISILLDPFASHNLKDIFLKHFLQVVGITFNYDLSTLATYPNWRSPQEYRDMDILMIDHHHDSAIIIENKIEAEDSNHEEEGQLEKYYRIVSEEEGISKEHIHVIYLSLDREGPSNASIATSCKFPELPDKIINIHYGNELREWLELCLKDSYDKPMLRETIKQYKNLIEMMTNTVNIDEDVKGKMEIIGCSDENIKAAKLLSSHINYMYYIGIKEFWNDLTNILINNSYIIQRKIDEKECYNLVFGSTQKRKINFNLEIVTPSKHHFTINGGYDCILCIGMTESDSAYCGRRIPLGFFENEKSNLNLQNEEGWIFYRDFMFPMELAGEYPDLVLDLNNMYEDLNFNLISYSKRTSIINHVFSQIQTITQTFDEYFKKHMD